MCIFVYMYRQNLWTESWRQGIRSHRFLFTYYSMLQWKLWKHCLRLPFGLTIKSIDIAQQLIKAQSDRLYEFKKNYMLLLLMALTAATVRENIFLQLLWVLEPVVESHFLLLIAYIAPNFALRVLNQWSQNALKQFETIE